jgi:phage FluMu protein Com
MNMQHWLRTPVDRFDHMLAACGSILARHFTTDRAMVTCPHCRRVIEDDVTTKTEVPT